MSESETATRLLHSHVNNGKRRCLNRKMAVDQHLALREVHDQARQARLNVVSDDEILYIGVRFRVLTPDTNRTFSDALSVCQSILNMMNGAFGNKISPLHDTKSIERGALLDYHPHHRDIYEKQKQLAGSPNLQFLMAGSPTLDYVPSAHKHSGCDVKDMDYWDQLLKLQIAPAIDGEHLYNIWIVMDVKSVLLGYGNFPKVNPTPRDIALDGFVYFISGPPYHLHVTSVHESGHVWGLNHLFNHDEKTGEYEDGIEDTPYQDVPDFGPVWFKKEKWPSSVDKRTGEKSFHLLSNYMNYVDDDCMYCFTGGQARRIRDTALTVRAPWNLEKSQVEGLRGGSPWVSVRLSNPYTASTASPCTPSTNKDQKKERKQKNVLLPLTTQTTPFPFKRRYVAPEHTLKYKPGKNPQLPETSLNTFGGVWDLCGSLFGVVSSATRMVDTTGKTLAALSFACC